MTVAVSAESTAVARRVIGKLNLDTNAKGVLTKVSANPVAQSNIVRVAAQADTPEGAKQLADTFAQEFVAERTDQLHETVDDLITSIESNVEDSTESGDPNALEAAANLQYLEFLRTAPDPNVRVQTTAELPDAVGRDGHPVLRVLDLRGDANHQRVRHGPTVLSFG